MTAGLQGLKWFACPFMLLGCATTISAQDGILPVRSDTIHRSDRSGVVNPQSIHLDSGWVFAAGNHTQPVLVYSGQVTIDDAMWVRLYFDLAVLGGEVGDVNASYIVLTSALDGATQMMWAEDIRAWSDSSAYFNGDTVFVDIYAASGISQSRVRITDVEYGEPGFLDRSLCGAIDDRIRSNHPSIARLLPSQCTAWLMEDMPGGFLTAGHCAVAPGSLVQFNVPDSTIGGSMVHPDPADQYPIDMDSIQHQSGSGGLGNDWLFFGAFANGATGLSPLAAQGESLHLAATAPPDDGRLVSVIGYGRTSQPASLEHNFTQLTGVGLYAGGGARTARYLVDTTGGDSGAPVIDLVTGQAIAIHTNPGCNSDGWNRGTRTNHPDLSTALASPLGVAGETDGLRFTFPQGRPVEVNKGGGTALRVRIRPSDTRSVFDDTAVLHVFDGTVWSEIPMTQITDQVYRGFFPAFDECVTSVQYFVSAMNTLGQIDTWPRAGAEDPFEALVVSFGTPVGEIVPEESSLWSFASDILTTSGTWTLAPPPELGRMGPTEDFDLSGLCLLTGSGEGEDVDGGHTFAVSPKIRTKPGTQATLSMAVWYASTSFGDEGLSIEITVDDGNEWIEIDRVYSTDGWEVRVYPTSDFAVLRSELHVRFSVSDAPGGVNTPDGGIVEAAIDRILLTESPCGSSSP